MSKIGSIDQIKKLRQKTGVGVMDARRALEEGGGEMKKAREWLRKQAVTKAAKKSNRSCGDGGIFSYLHQTGKIAAMVKLGCETDFVARTDEFQRLGKEIAMQVASMSPGNVAKLMEQEWIRDAKKTIKQLVEEYIAKLGENIKVVEFVRMAV